MRERGEKVRRCIQMPVLNCSNRAGYLVWARRLNSTPTLADFCVQPVMFVLVVAVEGEKNDFCHIWFEIEYSEGLHTDWGLIKNNNNNAAPDIFMVKRPR